MNYFNIAIKQISSFLTVVISICLATLYSCNPITQTDSTYSLTGRMLKDCSGDPYKNYSLTFYIPGAGLGQKTTELGTVSTDDKGYFKLSNIPSNQSANIYLKHTIDANYVTTWGSFTIPGSANIYDDNAVYDLGDYYGEFSLNAVTSILIDNSSYNNQDTLYIGYHSNHFQVISPIPDKFIYKFKKSGKGSRQDSYPSEEYITWGIGKTFFDSLYIPGAVANKDDYKFFTKLSFCTYPDTTYYSIP